MHRILAISCATLFAIAVSARAADVAAANVQLQYEGIDEPQATAIAETLSAARAVYVEFGFDMPQMIVAKVNCAADLPTRLYTDGRDHVFLSIPDRSKLDRPAKSGVFNLYGMCHELGHIAMYRTLQDRDWMPGPAAEGWAHYVGSVVVDRVYENKGERLWADPYDYREDGTQRLLRAQKVKSVSKTDQAATHWQQLDQILGRAKLKNVFEAWQAAKPEPGKEKQALLAALTGVDAAREKDLAAWWASASPALVAPVPVSGTKAETIDRKKLSGQVLKLDADDGSPDGKRSIAGGGHVRLFTTPGNGGWYVVAVSVFGSRYGPTRPPPTKFDLAVCDSENKPIKVVPQSYSAFERGGEGKWTRFELAPVRVPESFAVCLNFRPTATNGVFVNWDSSTHGHSFVSTPGTLGDALDTGDWLIRVELDRPADADALK